MEYEEGVCGVSGVTVLLVGDEWCTLDSVVPGWDSVTRGGVTVLLGGD